MQNKAEVAPGSRSWNRPNQMTLSRLLVSVNARVAEAAMVCNADLTLKDDDLDAFYSLVAPELPKMGRVAARLAGFDNRDDVVQDALLRAWRSREQFDPTRGTLSAWLLTITAHEATRVRRRVANRVVRRSSPSPLGPDEAIDLAQALGLLTARERLAVDCYYFAGLSVTETAGVMRCSDGTVKSTLFSARERLRGMLR